MTTSIPRLKARSSVSFTLQRGTIDDLTRWLIEQRDFIWSPGHAPAEAGRLTRWRMLVVAYHSGTLLCQGSNNGADAARVLAELADAPAPEVPEPGALWELWANEPGAGVTITLHRSAPLADDESEVGK